MAYELAVHKGILLLGAATWAKADAVITSDDDLLSMKLWRGIDILTPAQWVVRAMAL